MPPPDDERGRPLGKAAPRNTHETATTTITPRLAEGCDADGVEVPIRCDRCGATAMGEVNSLGVVWRVSVESWSHWGGGAAHRHCGCRLVPVNAS